MTLAVPIEGQDLRMGQEARHGGGLRQDRKTASRRVRSGERQAFDLQQTAENLTKAVLAAHQIRPPSGHGTGEAAAKLPVTYVDRHRFLALDHLSDFLRAYRYPSPPETKLPPKPSFQDVKKWIEQVKQLAERFERWLAARETAR
jgi:HEPN domain-containing protein